MIPTNFFEAFAHAAAPLAVAGLWQGLAVALALALCLRFLPHISAAQRFLVWSAGMLAIVASPLLPLVLQIAGPTGGSGLKSTSSQAWFQLDERWTLAIVSLWLIASFVRAVDLVLHMIRLWRLWSSAEPIEVTALPRSQRRFQVCATQFLDRPSVIGFFAPRVLIPDWLLPRLTPDELEQIVLHESTHLARRDDWTNLFQKLCLVLFPLNPALWAIDRQLGKEREMACDEAVVRITQAPRAYAACLASLAERGLALRKEALSLGAWQHRSELARRVHRILGDHRSLSPRAARMLLGAFGCSLLVATVELAHCPKLVAFVPAAQASERASVSSTSGEAGDAVYPTDARRADLTANAHLVQTKAEMPSPSIMKPVTRRDHLMARVEGEPRTVSSEPGATAHTWREVAARKRVRSSADAPQQLIVFTAWEQIETATPTSQTTISDYDTQPAANVQSTAKADTATPAKNDAQSRDGKSATTSMHRTTVTQLILRIVPAGSKSKLPAAIPFGDGWLVIQL